MLPPAALADVYRAAFSGSSGEPGDWFVLAAWAVVAPPVAARAFRSRVLLQGPGTVPTLEVSDIDGDRRADLVLGHFGRERDERPPLMLELLLTAEVR